MLLLKQKHGKNIELCIRIDCLKGDTQGSRQAVTDTTSGHHHASVPSPTDFLQIASLAHKETFNLDPLYWQYKIF